MAYNKKMEYRPAEITAKRIKYNSKAKKAFAQTGSKIIIGGNEIPPDDLNVKELYAVDGNS